MFEYAVNFTSNSYFFVLFDFKKVQLVPFVIQTHKQLLMKYFEPNLMIDIQKIGPYVVIGNSAQHPKSKSNGSIVIGNNNTFNEYCNVHLPTKIKQVTSIGNNNYFMNSTTIDH